ncbi:prepilin-type N-terminal cleavage/methylation domain-containing protein [Vibrio owensii]
MKSKGFTLIELVIAIVILGILAVVAAPRFLNLQKDSKVAVMETVAASMKAGLEMVHARAIVEGLDQGEQEIRINVC